ncbi:MAG TPA: hypothetical protein VGB03_02520, partial [Acidimicrobiales bacterium]|jgi:hypothetical protein
MTAHWYGQLHRDYLDKIEQASRRWSGTGRPFFVSEFGDWGLPEMPLLEDPPFWDTRETYSVGLAGTMWPDTIGRFVRETQRYQGLSDRLQAEVWRRHDDINGYCLTELTDVPHELNGLLDLHRRPKPLAVAEVRRANQTVLPMLEFDSLVAVAGSILRARVHVSNDGPELHDVVVEARFGDTATPMGLEELLALDSSHLSTDDIVGRFSESVAEARCDHLCGYAATAMASISVVVPDVPGSHDLVLRLRAADGTEAENRYPIHVVRPRFADVAVRVAGSPTTEESLRTVGARIGDSGPLVVGENELDAAVGEQVRAALADGSTVLVLAQPPEAAAHYPVPVTLDPIATAWGSTVFHFTTDHGAIASLPRRNVLVAEDSTIQATSVVGSIAGVAFPDTPVVLAYKPVPGAMTGTIVGSHAVGQGRLVLCQYRVRDRVIARDAAACALLADLVRWAAVGRPTLDVEPGTMADGRQITSYTWRTEAGR